MIQHKQPKNHKYHKIKLHIRKKIFSFNFSNVIIVFLFILSFVYGITGSYLLRGQISGINNLKDAFYFTVVTFSTLGDGRMIPLTYPAKYFVITMVSFGFGIFAMVASLIFYRVANHLQSVVSKFQGGKIYMKNHIILCGYSAITELLIVKFQRKQIPFILLDRNPHPELESGEGGNFVYVSTPNRRESLIKANIETCKMLIASSDSDSENILAAVTARKLMEAFEANFKIVTRILYEENIEVATNNGASDVISPTMMAANAILELI